MKKKHEIKIYIANKIYITNNKRDNIFFKGEL